MTHDLCFCTWEKTYFKWSFCLSFLSVNPSYYWVTNVEIPTILLCFTNSLSLALLSHYFLTISSRQSWNLFWISVKNMFLRINLLYIFICLWKNSFYILYIVYILIYLSLSTGYFNNNQYLWSLLLISVIVKQFTAK